MSQKLHHDLGKPAYNTYRAKAAQGERSVGLPSETLFKPDCVQLTTLTRVLDPLFSLSAHPCTCCDVPMHRRFTCEMFVNAMSDRSVLILQSRLQTQPLASLIGFTAGQPVSVLAGAAITLANRTDLNVLSDIAHQRVCLSVMSVCGSSAPMQAAVTRSSGMTDCTACMTAVLSRLCLTSVHDGCKQRCSACCIGMYHALSR